MENSFNSDSSKPVIKVLLADDHPLVTEGISACLNVYGNITVVGTAQNGDEALEKAELLRPDVVLMDINMPGRNGLETIISFRDQYPQIKLLMLSMHDNREYIISAIRNGACGYILKDVPSADVVTAIEAVYHGGNYFSSGLSMALLDVDQEYTTGALTAREELVLTKLAQGDTNKVAAKSLDISFRTVETHRKNIKRKLGISSTAGLTRYAIDNGLV